MYVNPERKPSKCSLSMKRIFLKTYVHIRGLFQEYKGKYFIPHSRTISIEKNILQKYELVWNVGNTHTSLIPRQYRKISAQRFIRKNAFRER